MRNEKQTEKQSVDELLAERGRTHGEYTDHARVTQALKRVMAAEPSYAALPDIVKETLDMVAHKLGRVLTGNPFLKDHYDDIAGYARLVSQRINDEQTGLLPQYQRPASVTPGTDSSREMPKQLSVLDVGRKFLNRRGDIVTVHRYDGHDVYPYDIRGPDCSYSVTSSGTEYNRIPTIFDLVARAD